MRTPLAFQGIHNEAYRKKDPFPAQGLACQVSRDSRPQLQRHERMYEQARRDRVRYSL